LEVAGEAGEEGRQEDVCYEGHYRDIHIWGIDVVPGWKEVCLGLPARICSLSTSAGPWFVPPGEEYETEFIEDVAIRDVEVVL